LRTDCEEAISLDIKINPKLGFVFQFTLYQQ